MLTILRRLLPRHTPVKAALAGILCDAPTMEAIDRAERDGDEMWIGVVVARQIRAARAAIQQTGGIVSPKRSK